MSKKHESQHAASSVSATGLSHHDAYRGLVELVSDFYWEQDGEGRVTRLIGHLIDQDAVMRSDLLGKTLWEAGFKIAAAGGWPAFRAVLESQAAFRDQSISKQLDDGTVRYFRISGEAVVDSAGNLVGHRGIGKDATEEELHQRELLQFRAAMDASQDMIFIVDRETMRFVYVNQMACQQTRYSREALLELPPHKLMMVDQQQLEHDYDAVIAAGGLTMERRGLTSDGRRAVVEVHRRALQLDGRWLIVSIAHNISARKYAESARDRLARMYAALSATNEAILRAATRSDLYQQVCDAAVQGGGLALAAVLLANSEDASLTVAAGAGADPECLERLPISVNRLLPQGRGLVGEAFRSREPRVSNDYLRDERTRHWHRAAQTIGINSAAAAPLIKQGESLGVMLVAAKEKAAFDDDNVKLLQRMADNLVFALENFEREEARQRGEQHIQYLATHDSLTGLPNRTLFNQVLAMATQATDRYGHGFALLFIDLDRFKIINDSLGHEAGDAVLKAMAQRFQACLRASDMVARIGGDEFVALIQEVEDRDVVTAVARKMLAAALDPLEIYGQECRVTASIGIALCPDDANDASALMKSADMAMYQAKEDGKNTFRLYRPDMKVRTLARITLETHLRLALKRGELALVYQAKTSLATREITGVEALLRWHSPELGEVTPTQFIPVAEETGLIIPIGRWVLETACAQNVAWQKAGLAPLCIAVNLSPVQFADRELFDHIQTVLENTGLSPELLELEITESALIHHTEQAVQLLREIKSLGVRIAIDDFGTGYSSLAQLGQLPVDTLKIDRSFIRELPYNQADQSIARAIIALGRNLHLTIIAEGVETNEQQAFLLSQDCDDMQGFYFSRPGDPEAFAELLRKHSGTMRRSNS